MLPDSTVFPTKVLLPICVVDPVTLKLPVNVVFPINVFEPLVNKLPVTVWAPMNVLDPVVANLPEDVLLSSKELLAQLAVPNKAPVKLVAVTLPLTLSDPVTV